VDQVVPSSDTTCSTEIPKITRQLVRRLAQGAPQLAEPQDPLDGGLSIVDWCRLWKMCHAVTGNGIWLIQWPDGRSLLEQPSLLLEMFEIIEDQFTAEIASSVKQ
jgi:hypothetical protein